MARGAYSHYTTCELQHRRTAIYTEIDLLRAEFVAIGRKIERRSQASEGLSLPCLAAGKGAKTVEKFRDEPGRNGKSLFARLASVIWRRHP